MYILRKKPVYTLRYLPDFLSKDDVFKNTALICDKQHEKLRVDLLDLKNQIFIETATWRLADWERVLNISVKPNATYDERRNQILLKFQGANAVTEKFMNNLINMFCEDKSGYIIQHNPEYWFEVVLNGNQKLDLDSLSDAIETYKPAHLGYTYSVNISLDSRRYIGSKVGTLRSYYLEPKTIDDTVVNPKQYRLGKISNIKYMDIDMAGIITEVNIDNKKYMLADIGQLRETNISIDNFIRPLDFDVKINYARSFNLYKVNDIDLNSLNKVDVNVNSTTLAKATSLKEYEIKTEDET